jgi:hypothetical protein
VSDKKREPLYKVETDPLHSGRFIIVVAATGKQAHGTGSYPNKGQASRACSAKNRGK